MTFKDLGIVEPILKALNKKGYLHPTPIQEQAIPILLKGKDLMGCAQTGTGKTAAFAIPIIQHIYNSKQNDRRSNKIKALIVTPTRELAIQIFDNFKIYGENTNIKCNVIFGGVKQHAQTASLKQGVDVLVATPGRLLDLMNQGFISLRDIEYFVLDEADQMLDMGFIHDIKKILAKLPQKRQSLFFSATMPKSIVELSRKILGDFDTVTIKPEQATAEKVEQAIYFIHKKAKIKLLIHLLETQSVDSTLVFSRTKHGANKIVKLLVKAGISSAAIHGNKSQTARVKALEGFKEGKIKVLVATDIAARGIDIDELALVVNYDLPNVSETYVHRIGRTGRAKASGVAVSFCDQEERAYLRDIEKLIKQKIQVIADHPFVDFKDDSLQSNEKLGQYSKPKKSFNKNRNSRNRNNNNKSNSNNNHKKRSHSNSRNR
ncbi:DEAD/DEAH box helicase [Aureibaculum marinum]|uniref:DEAD-box ATP-dependent RNA helicase RhpA n=1 Tax=Aureibaculum marinum TaxID=2487930 RepID=A0A3N4NYI8_9FLAO|nr:DEAD/DEAH box helicase [Aureibaculum marinum]RPD99887.1 DEAD/DEAH box helicase [Aureibaculum marinum]